MTQKQKENIKHERVLKLKKIGFWILNIVSYILAGLFLIVLIISLATPKKQNVSPRSAYKLYDNVITEVIREDSPNNVVYDDEDYKITLTANECVYEYTNLYTWSINHDFNAIISITYHQVTLTNFDDTNQSSVIWDNNIIYIAFMLDYVDYGTPTLPNYNYYFFDNNTDTLLTDCITLNINSLNYDDVKNAIELDIQANESTLNDSIFDSLANVLTNFITTLNSGVTAVINLFWDSTNLQLTLLGNLTTIVVGVAVCFFLFRLVIGLIRLRG